MFVHIFMNLAVIRLHFLSIIVILMRVQGVCKDLNKRITNTGVKA